MPEKEKRGAVGAQVAPAMGPPGFIAREEIPQVLPILPLRNSVFFPGGVLPLAVGRAKTIALIKDAVRDEQVIGVVSQRRAEEEDPGADDLYTIGTVARVVKLLKMGEDNYSLVVQGLARFRVVELVQENPYLKARVDPVEDKTPADDVEIEALAINLKKLAREVIELMPDLPAAATELFESITHPGHLADLIAANVDFTIEEKQQVLEMVDLKGRMQLALELLNRKREILKLSNKIDSAVKGEMSKTQREYYLRQQLKAIKEELGEIGEEEEELDELAERLKKAGLPPDVEKVSQKELSRLKSIPTASSEYTVARTYLDWIADLPWSKRTEDNLDIENARTVLDTDHYGLQKVKKRILEYLAVRKLKNDMQGPILCLVGPPGRRQDLARPVGRQGDQPQVRPALTRRRAGRGRDPRPSAHLRRRAARPDHPGDEEGRDQQPGHHARRDRQARGRLPRRPERGAARGARSRAEQQLLRPLPRRAVRPLEGHVHRHGQPARPHPGPLRDRMEILELPGYTLRGEGPHRPQPPDPEAAQGARAPCRDGVDHRAGDHQDHHRLHARGRRPEPGAPHRGHLPRRSRWRSRAARSRSGTSASIVEQDVEEMLGPEKFYNETAERTELPGVATGLAWTAAGGDILFIEATKMQGKGSLTLTGQLGDVMKESAQAALSYLRSKADTPRHPGELPRAAPTSTSTSRRARSRRTGRAPASRS